MHEELANVSGLSSYVWLSAGSVQVAVPLAKVGDLDCAHRTKRARP